MPLFPVRTLIARFDFLELLSPYDIHLHTAMTFLTSCQDIKDTHSFYET